MGKVTLTIEFPVTVPDGMKHPDFHFEEHICVEDLVEKRLLPLFREHEGRGTCCCYMVKGIVYEDV